MLSIPTTTKKVNQSHYQHECCVCGHWFWLREMQPWPIRLGTGALVTYRICNDCHAATLPRTGQA
jgi:hypothetical protein